MPACGLRSAKSRAGHGSSMTFESRVARGVFSKAPGPPEGCSFMFFVFQVVRFVSAACVFVRDPFEPGIFGLENRSVDSPKSKNQLKKPCDS